MEEEGREVTWPPSETRVELAVWLIAGLLATLVWQNYAGSQQLGRVEAQASAFVDLATSSSAGRAELLAEVKEANEHLDQMEAYLLEVAGK
jgi:hypothetical protein